MVFCLFVQFLNKQDFRKRSAGFGRGNWTVTVLISGNPQKNSFDIDAFHPNEKTYNSQGFYQNSNDVIVFKTHRDIPYQHLTSLTTDLQKNINEYALKRANK